MIQERPICFSCERVIDHSPVYAPPFDDDPTSISGTFHGICLMEWREKRADFMERARKAREAFFRHLNGDCGCAEA